VTTATEGPAASHSLWRNLDYLLFWGGGSLSLVGSTMSRIAFPLLVLEITRSAASAGLVGALAALPYPILGLPAGALADRWNRKRTMIVCDLGRAAALGSVPLALWAGHAGLLQLCIVAAIEGSLFTFYDAAWHAAVPRVVSAQSLPSALALNQGTLGMAGIVGPPLGGVLYGVARSLPFLADAVSYLLSMG
jgi:MFS family permease